MNKMKLRVRDTRPPSNDIMSIYLLKTKKLGPRFYR